MEDLAIRPDRLPVQVHILAHVFGRESSGKARDGVESLEPGPEFFMGYGDPVVEIYDIAVPRPGMLLQALEVEPCGALAREMLCPRLLIADHVEIHSHGPIVHACHTDGIDRP